MGQERHPNGRSGRRVFSGSAGALFGRLAIASLFGVCYAIGASTLPEGARTLECGSLLLPCFRRALAPGARGVCPKRKLAFRRAGLTRGRFPHRTIKQGRRKAAKSPPLHQIPSTHPESESHAEPASWFENKAAASRRTPRCRDSQVKPQLRPERLRATGKPSTWPGQQTGLRRWPSELLPDTA